MPVFIDFLLHMENYLPQMIAAYGNWVYLFLFLVIFVETGLVIFPFLPGDSILFLTGSLATLSVSKGQTGLNPIILIVLLSFAAIIGDTVNFEIGKRLEHVFTPQTGKKSLIKPEYLERSKAFFDKHGNLAIFLGRFIPIIRTIIPFTAGISRMHYGTFIKYNFIGGITWVTVAVGAGYFFGSMTFIQEHFSLITVAIVLISLIPVFITAINSSRRKTSVQSEESKKE